MRDQLRGCIRISAKGKELYCFINAIHSEKICCFGQYCRHDIFYGEIYRRDLHRLEEIAEKYGIELNSAEIQTLSSILLRYRKRIGLLIGVVLAIVTFMYFSSVVVTIEIQGNSTVSDEKILSALDELGIREGTRINDIDLHNCSNNLRVMVEGISWAGIRHTGNRIVVEVTEVVPPPEIPSKRVACNIVSEKKAKITSVKVLDGQLIHKIGDYVTEGSLLVSGVTVSNTGRNVIHHAIAEITGEYEETVVFSGIFAPIRKVRTGRTKKRDTLKLFNLEIPLNIGKCKFSNFDITSTYEPLCLFGKELPVGIMKDKLTETELTVEMLTPEQLEAELNAKIFLYEKNFISSDTKIINRTIEKNQDENGITFTVHYKLEGDIGIEKPLLLSQEQLSYSKH